MDEYKKVVYVWNEPKAPAEVPARLSFHAMNEDSMDILLETMSRVMADSMDRSDHHEVNMHGARQAAEALLSEVNAYYTYNLSWWQFAYDSDNELVGFVQPVAFPAKFQKGGLEEATIAYIGVLPEKRGDGYATDLLCQSTKILQEVGVWRIYCDTDVYNMPMIETFVRAGYEQDGEPKVVEL